MPVLRLITIIIVFLALSFNSAFCANYKVKELILDNSDRMVVIKGQGNFKTQNTGAYAPIPTSTSSSIKLLTSISTFTISAPNRYVVDIPNAVLIGSKRTYEMANSSAISTIQLSQFSANPDIVRVVFTLKGAANFKTYTNGTDVIVKYAPNIIDNSIKYKFYTPSGDSNKTNSLQTAGAALSYSTSDEKINITPNLISKYHLSQISQSANGLILRGIGAISLQRTTYNSDNTKAQLIIDNASINSKLDSKTYNIPSSSKEYKANLTINKQGENKIKLTLEGDNLRDYRFIVSPDAQSLFITHRTFIINTNFSSGTKATGYKITKNNNGYILYDFNFLNPVAYNVFELNDNFYLDINNLSDYSEALFKSAFKDSNIQVLKISNDKTRFIIPSNNLNFSYANVESNAKSITLCFREKPASSSNTKTVSNVSTPVKIEKQDNINVIYIPKEEDKVQKQNAKPKKTKENATISSLKKVVLDAGHGGSDTGAIGGGIYEKTITLEVVKLVEARLKKKNIHVYLTRDKDKTLTLEDRTNYSNEINPDIFVSIHVNSTVASDPYGLETHYYKDDSYELAKTIHSNFASDKNLKQWGTKDRGVIKSRFYVINHTEAPSVLIEIGFISNKVEREKLITKQRQEEIADAVTKGILEYLGVK